MIGCARLVPLIGALLALLALPHVALAQDAPRGDHGRGTGDRLEGRCDQVQSRRSPPVVIASPRIEDFLLYAERSIVLGRHDTACGGDIGIRSIATSQSAQLRLDADAFVDPSHNLLAPTVSLSDDTRVGTVQSNLLNAQATVATTFPTLAMPALPLPNVPAAGSVDVSVPSDTEYGLVPGNYGRLDVQGRVLLTAGEYTFTDMSVAEFGAIIALSGGVRVDIAHTLIVGSGASITAGPGKAAGDLFVSVAGSDRERQAPATFGSHARIHAMIAVPRGTLAFGDRVEATGASAGFDIRVGNNVRLDYESGFTEAETSRHGQQQLSGYYGPTPYPAVAPLVGPVPESTYIELDIGLPVRDAAGLQDFIKHVSDPRDPNYRKYLTIDAFTAQYGAPPADYAAVVDWAKSNGLRVYRTFPNNLMLSVSGTAAQFEQALYTNLVFRKRLDGSQFLTVDRDLSVDLAVRLLHISGLDDFYLPHPSTPTGANGNFAAADLRAAYYGAGAGSTCQALSGAGQSVGIFALELYKPADIQAYDARQNPPLLPGNVSTATVEGGYGYSTPTGEAPLDIEMAQAMAPNAKIWVFEGTLGITSHGDATLHSMATWSPVLSSASNSYDFAINDSAQQALWEMAAQGTTYFAASGDYGAIGDPGSLRDADAQTLVGGTMLNTNPLTAAGAYPPNYYVNETTWNGGQPGKDITGGGIMNGVQDTTNIPNSFLGTKNCYCWPYKSCCPKGVLIPEYQKQILMTTNGGSTFWRNYPDVSAVAQSLDTNCSQSAPGVCTDQAGQSGTSAASPIWAGFLAVADELSAKNHVGNVGFANPVLYLIGLTRGSAVDLYAKSFNDVQLGLSTGVGGVGGFSPVPGYDLATGLGTPTCGLINQLGTSTPLQPNQPLQFLEFLITTGHDNLRPDSAANAVVTFASGQTITIDLKDSGSGAVQGPNWDDSYMNDLVIDLTQPPFNLSPLPTPTQGGITSVTVNLIENPGNSGIDEDNWDISGLNVRLFGAGSQQEICQLDLPGNNNLQDNHMGLVRLSASAGGSGVGPSVTFPGGAGCAPTGSPNPASPAQIQLIFDTGDDDLRSDSGLTADIYAPGGTNPAQTVQLKAFNTPKWDNNTLENVIVPLTVPVIDHIVLNLQRNPDPCGCSGKVVCICTLGDDKWDLAAINVMTWQANAPETCWATSGAGNLNGQSTIFVNPTWRLNQTGCVAR